jgi:hypothetical protein
VCVRNIFYYFELQNYKKLSFYDVFR